MNGLRAMGGPRRALFVAFAAYVVAVPTYCWVRYALTGQGSWPWGWQMFS